MVFCKLKMKERKKERKKHLQVLFKVNIAYDVLQAC